MNRHRVSETHVEDLNINVIHNIDKEVIIIIVAASPLYGI